MKPRRVMVLMGGEIVRYPCNSGLGFDIILLLFFLNRVPISLDRRPILMHYTGVYAFERDLGGPEKFSVS